MQSCEWTTSQSRTGPSAKTDCSSTFCGITVGHVFKTVFIKEQQTNHGMPYSNSVSVIQKIDTKLDSFQIILNMHYLICLSNRTLLIQLEKILNITHTLLINRVTMLIYCLRKLQIISQSSLCTSTYG